MIFRHRGLRSKETGERVAAARELGSRGDQRAVKPLIAALGDQDWSVREAAARALGELGDARAVQPLIPALGDRDEDWRCARQRPGRSGSSVTRGRCSR